MHILYIFTKVRVFAKWVMHEQSQGVWGYGNWRIPWNRTFRVWTVTNASIAEKHQELSLSTDVQPTDKTWNFYVWQVCQHLYVTSDEAWLGHFLTHMQLNQVRILNCLKKKGTTEDEMVGWHHRLNGHGFGYTPAASDGQGGLVCCGSWGHKELDTTERLKWK